MDGWRQPFLVVVLFQFLIFISILVLTLLPFFLHLMYRCNSPLRIQEASFLKQLEGSGRTKHHNRHHHHICHRPSFGSALDFGFAFLRRVQKPNQIKHNGNRTTKRGMDRNGIHLDGRKKIKEKKTYRLTLVTYTLTSHFHLYPFFLSSDFFLLRFGPVHTQTHTHNFSIALASKFNVDSFALRISCIVA